MVEMKTVNQLYMNEINFKKEERKVALRWNQGRFHR